MVDCYLIGAGGHAKVVIEILEVSGNQISGLFDDHFSAPVALGYPVMKWDNKPFYDNKSFLISIGNNKIRKRIAEENPDMLFYSAIHPSANISKRTEISSGTVIMAGVSINSEVKIGKHCIINTNASVDHDCKIGDYVHISPNAALSGTVTIGEGTHVGTGVSIIQGIKIGKWCTIGAGSVIIRDVPNGCTVVGNPGRVIKKINL